MKIICIGRNYGAHAKELGNALPAEPVFFLKPESALLPAGTAFKIPDWSANIHYELELVLRISRECRNAQVNDVNAYVDAITLGIDFTARDIQDELKKNGLPWEKAKAFDGSAVIGNGFLPLPTDLTSQTFHLELNDRIVQKGNVSDMIFTPAALLSHISRYITLLPGDLVFTGTPAGVGPVSKGDHLIGKMDGTTILDLRIEG